MSERASFVELLGTLHSELANIIRLVDIAENQEQIESNASANETLLQACLVLAVAQTEGYTKAVAAEFTEALNRSGVPLRRIAEPIRHLHTVQTIQELAACDDHTRGNRIRSLRAQLNLWWDDDRALRPAQDGGKDGLISKRKIQREVTSINSAQVTELLQLLGCERDICGETVDLLDAATLRELLESGGLTNGIVAREPWEVGAATANVGEKLTDLVTKRNTIAHGNGKISLSKGDLLSALAFLCSFAALLQDAVRDHLRQTLTLG